MKQYVRAAELFEDVRPLFMALGDEARQEILLLLACQPGLGVGELTAQTSLSRPAVSHHIRILRDAGLVSEEREGTKRYYRPTFRQYIAPMRKLVDYAETMK